MPIDDPESSRRRFLGGLASASGAALLAAAGRSAAAAPSSDWRPQGRRLRYALVGTGHRGTGQWGAKVQEGFSDVVEFVGLCDPNPKRSAAGRKLIGTSCRTFTNFDVMCEQTKPDMLAIMTVDAHHAEYIVKGLERGLKVMTEKPMVTDESQCQAVLDAERKSGNPIIVTFNYRFAPRHDRIKQILMSGELGRVVAVSFDWHLDTQHGADYFRRWHRLKENSGSLLVHKASHHFDLINWWLDAEPVEVAAQGGLRRYGKNGDFRHSHCRPCPHKGRCDFHRDITSSERLTKLYIGPESYDGYHRDGCVFRKDVDIYDSMSALVKYNTGVAMSYSLNAFMPYEGYNLVFTCERGTLAARLVERLPGGDRMEITVTKNFAKDPPHVERPKASKGHGGADDRLLNIIFRGQEAPAHLALPGSRAGAMACLTGIAARRSIEQGRPVRIADLVNLA